RGRRRRPRRRRSWRSSPRPLPSRTARLRWCTPRRASACSRSAARRFRRSLDGPPIPDEPAGDAVVREGFAEAEPERVLAHRLHGAGTELALVVADQAVRFLAEHDLGDVAIVTLAQGRRAAEVTLRARPDSPRPLAVQERLLELAGPFAARLGADGQAALTPDHDVRWRIAG